MYLVNTRLDICYAVNTLSQFMVEPKRAHWAVAKHVLRYIQGTVDYGLLYTRSKDIRLSGFTNADWAGSSVDLRSTSGYCFNIRSGMTSLCSRRKMEATRIICDNQSCIKLSENPMFHDQSKHIDTRCHFVRDCVQRGAVQLSYTPTGEQVVDILTKALGRTKFDYFREKMGMIRIHFSSRNGYDVAVQ
eukprot:PITA_33479